MLLGRSEEEVDGRRCCRAVDMRCPKKSMMIFWIMSKNITSCRDTMFLVMGVDVDAVGDSNQRYDPTF